MIIIKTILQFNRRSTNIFQFTSILYLRVLIRVIYITTGLELSIEQQDLTTRPYGLDFVTKRTPVYLESRIPNPYGRMTLLSSMHLPELMNLEVSRIFIA